MFGPFTILGVWKSLRVCKGVQFVTWLEVCSQDVDGGSGVRGFLGRSGGSAAEERKTE